MSDASTRSRMNSAVSGGGLFSPCRFCSSSSPFADMCRHVHSIIFPSIPAPLVQASGKQQMPAQAPAPEKRGLKWHSDKSLVDVKDITSRDFDQDYVVALSLFVRSPPSLSSHPCTDSLVRLCARQKHCFFKILYSVSRDSPPHYRAILVRLC